MQRIRKGDEVIIITGKAENKGQRGIVKSVKGDKIIIEGLNLALKHIKPNPQLGIDGGIIKKESFIHVSNVMLYNQVTGKGDRVGFKLENGKKIRFFKSNGERID